MIRITLSLWFLTCAAAIVRSQETDAKTSLPNGYHEVDDDITTSIEKLCKATADTGLFTGAVLVAKEGKVIYKAGFGMANREWMIPNTPDTRFRLASVSKQFCAMLVMQLVQEGKLRLDQTISEFLPYYRKDTGDRITLHHLLSHQSGIRDFTAGFDYRGKTSRLSFDQDSFITQFCSDDLEHEPGTIYSYCNSGYIILGRIIEKVTRKSFEQNLRERIFEPLEMKDSGYDRNRYVIPKRASGYTLASFGVENAAYMDMNSSPGAAGALYSTVEDMFRWDRALYTDKVLDKEQRDRMFTPNRDVPEVKAAGGRAQSVYGYGWHIYTRTHPVTKRRTKVINHGGAINGFRAMENRLVDDDAFVIVLCNQGDGIGGSQVWNSVLQLSTQLVHVVTEQPFRMPAKRGITQEQRMYNLVKNKSVDAAIAWFKANGKRTGWGAANTAVAKRLLEEGFIDEGIRLMEFDLEATPGKVWMLRNTARSCLEHGQFKRAVPLIEQGLELRPDDETFRAMDSEARKALSQL